jgi:hypothetical protein
MRASGGRTALEIIPEPRSPSTGFLSLIHQCLGAFVHEVFVRIAKALIYPIEN